MNAVVRVNAAPFGSAHMPTLFHKHPRQFSAGEAKTKNKYSGLISHDLNFNFFRHLGKAEIPLRFMIAKAMTG